MASSRIVLLALAFWLLAGAPLANAQSDSIGKRYALVIGNADYIDKMRLPKLNNSLNDAGSMQRALTAAGFQVTVVKNATRRDMNRAVEKFSEEIARESNSIGLFYYAGHGAQDNGLNYLIPVDAKVEYASDLETDGFDVRHVLEAMKEAHNQMNLVILDACRDNDLPRKRGGLRGLAKVDAPSGTFVAYAAAPGQGAYDGSEGENGVFTGELLKAMQLPGVPLEQMFKRVIAGVKAQTHGAQEPWSEASIQGEFYFINAPAGSSVTVTPPGAPPADSTQVDLAFWNSIKDENDPEAFKAYLGEFPSGRFASLAKLKLKELTAGKAGGSTGETQSIPKLAVQTTKPAAAKNPNEPSACDLLASSPYDPQRNGPGVPPDKIDADAAIAACRNVPPGPRNSYLLGRALQAGKQYQEALQSYRKAVDQGYLDAATNIGAMYANGLGVPQDFAQAMGWLRKAADQGFAPAQYSVGLLFLRGQGVTKDYAQAMQWYRKAADQGFAPAQYDIGVMFDNGLGSSVDFAEAMRWYRKAADQGNAGAQNNIGVMYYEGKGIPQDYAQAMLWYRKAADQGYAQAQYNIGVLIDKGNGVPQDYAQAMHWYRKAADQGHAQAQYNIGVLFNMGHGVGIDYAQAMQWFRKAADQGLAAAQYNVGVLFNMGHGVDIDYAQAMQWFRKAADQGFAAAQNNIGVLYQQGRGVPQNLAQARIWYNLAADQGYQLAKQNLSKISSQ